MKRGWGRGGDIVKKLPAGSNYHLGCGSRQSNRTGDKVYFFLDRLSRESRDVIVHLFGIRQAGLILPSTPMCHTLSLCVNVVRASAVVECWRLVLREGTLFR